MLQTTSGGILRAELCFRWKSRTNKTVSASVTLGAQVGLRRAGIMLRLALRLTLLLDEDVLLSQKRAPEVGRRTYRNSSPRTRHRRRTVQYRLCGSRSGTLAFTE